MLADSKVRGSEVDPSPLVLSLQEAAALAKVSDRHLRKFLVGGPDEYQPKLPVTRIGNRLTIRKTTLEKWLSEVEMQSTASLA